MERRFLLFLLLSFLVLMANALWTARNAPPRKPAGDADQAAVEGDVDPLEDEDDVEANGDAPAQANNEPPPDVAPAKQDAAPEGQAAEDGQANALPAEEDVPHEWVTLGAIDDLSEYRMLVTLTSAGAGVRRIELASPRYLDLDDRGGYLGHLELADDTGEGLLVGVVGPGTPADRAGLRAGDRILQAGGKEMKEATDPAAFDRLVQSHRPGAEFRLTVARDGRPLPVMTARLVRDPLDVVRPESENVLLRADKLPEGFVAPPSFLMTFSHINDRAIAKIADGNDPNGNDADEIAGVDLRHANWRITDQDETSVSFERRLPEFDLVVTKRYELARVETDETDAGVGKPSPDVPAYNLRLTLAIQNAGQQASSVAYQLDGPNGLPIEGWWYANKIGRNWGGAGLRDVQGRYYEGAPEQIGPATIAKGDAEPFEGGSMAYIGVDAQYFAAVLLPEKTDPEQDWIESAEAILVGPKPKPRSGLERLANVTCRLTSDNLMLKPGEQREHAYTVFAGPKRPALLEEYRAAEGSNISLADLIYYGWFGAIAKAMLWILHGFYSLFGNYGIAIVGLTVLVRGCMFPISRGQARSMVRMQELKPEMERLKEKYKGDQQKQAQAMQELYRKHNVNPLAGCLPMLIQLPIFVGLYRGLAVDIELRQASLFGDWTHWCSNLAAPDMLWNWSGVMPGFITRGTGMLALGPYLNVLPLVTVALWIVQQKLFMPPPANEQAELQQKIMKYMMLFMGLLFYKVPSGLCIYFISSTLWGIAERKLVPPPTANAEAAAAPPARGASRESATTPPAANAKRAAKNGSAAKKNTRTKSKRRR